MMGVRWSRLSEADRAVYRAVSAFLIGRLRERSTVEWALQLGSKDEIQRLAILDLIERSNARDLGEPWLSAWSLVQESWESPPVVDAPVAAYGVRRRLRAGDRTQRAVAAMVELVRPRLNVKPFSRADLHFRKPRTRPRSFSDLFSASLTSGELVDPEVLDLPTIQEPLFLQFLANDLEAALVAGLDIARRLGWDGERLRWRLGQLHRAYYVPAAARAGGHEPDQFHRGLAPAVKLLYATVMRLADVDMPAALGHAQRWKLMNTPVHIRLWAAASRDPRIAPADELGAWILTLNDRQFWNVLEFPEVAEVRALRFAEMNEPLQSALVARIRKRPPRSLWPRKLDAARLSNARLYWTLRELRRLEIGGAPLSPRDRSWLNSTIGQFPDLAKMAGIDAGFLESPQAHYVAPAPDSRFDLLSGTERLTALESALSSTRSVWDHDPARGAADWIRAKGNTSLLIADFEATADNGAGTPKVWDQFGWTHGSPANTDAALADPPSQGDVSRILALLERLPDATLGASIEGISHWLQSWEKQIWSLSEAYAVWSKLWPIAAHATNAAQPPDEEIDLNTVAPPNDDSEPMDLDTLNSPAGNLVSVFLAACPPIQGSDRPFDREGHLRSMRDTVISTTGRSGLIARHRLIESLPYFLQADPDWARNYLLTPLLTDDAQSLALWRAIARQPHFAKVLEIIGGPMTEHALDPRLGRETRQSLVFSLVLESLHAFKDARKPVVPYSRIQQMLRSLEDELRAHAADTVRQFIDGLSSISDGSIPPATREGLFFSCAAPFLEQVWPQERSLNTPGVAQALADLPAASGDAFAACVSAIERFLVPFQCWSLGEYGLYGEEDGTAKLARIGNAEKATAFLRLLDLTIGTTEGSVVPHDLSDALQQISSVAPALQESVAFRRLSTAARR